MKKYQPYVKAALGLGAKSARTIRTGTVVTAEWVRMKCQFGCDEYGRRLTCPPNSPAPDRTRKMLSEYRHALLLQGDDYVDLRKIVSVLERRIFLDGYYRAFGMATGPCQLCGKCPAVCLHAEEARPSMEACGIDVFATARANSMPIEVLKNRRSCGHYYSLILIE